MTNETNNPLLVKYNDTIFHKGDVVTWDFDNKLLGRRWHHGLLQDFFNKYGAKLLVKEAIDIIDRRYQIGHTQHLIIESSKYHKDEDIKFSGAWFKKLCWPDDLPSKETIFTVKYRPVYIDSTTKPSTKKIDYLALNKEMSGR